MSRCRAACQPHLQVGACPARCRCRRAPQQAQRPSPSRATAGLALQGARQIRERRTDARFLFLLPPSRDVLEQRLRGRGTDSAEVIEHRLALADRELEAVSFFDYVIVNDEVEACVASPGLAGLGIRVIEVVK